MLIGLSFILAVSMDCRMGLESMAIQHPELYRASLKLFSRSLVKNPVNLEKQVENFIADVKRESPHLYRLILPDRKALALRRLVDQPLLLSTELGEIVVAFQANDLRKTFLNSDDIFPEKTQPDFNAKEFRKIFPFFTGEVDLQFLGGQAYGEVKTYQHSGRLSRAAKDQARLYKYLLDGRRTLGTPIEVYYFFPLSPPSVSGIHWLEDQGFSVVIDQAP